MTSIYARPKPTASLAWSFNPQRETARHEYFSLWSLLETAMSGSRAAARGGLFGSLHIIQQNMTTGDQRHDRK